MKDDFSRNDKAGYSLPAAPGRWRYRVFSAFFLLFSPVCQGQIILSEVMFDPAGPENREEFIEIYNAGPSPVDLSGWQTGEGSSFDFLAELNDRGLVLQPQQYGVIFDSDYTSDAPSSYDTLIPDEALLLIIDGTTFGSRGLANSAAETIKLVNARGDTVQRYTYSPGNVPGFSDEKIILLGSNDSLNWGDSRRLHGTPGAKNSLTPVRLDLAVEDFSLQEGILVAGMPVSFAFAVINAGLEAVPRFRWQTFYDHNRNGSADTDEILEEIQESTLLTPGDTLIRMSRYENVPYGEIFFGISILFGDDQDTTNNVAVLSAFVDQVGRVNMVINEILFEPRPGFGEWVELFNNGVEAVNLRMMYFADSRDTLQISLEDRYLAPGDFLVLAGDSAIAEQYAVSFGQVTIRKGFPSLNNNFDDLRLLGPSGLLHDRVNYQDGWYGRETEPGTSLEKLNPDFNGQFSQHWRASVAPSGSTPGQQNSIHLTVLPSENELELSPNPFSPDGDGAEDFIAIRYQLNIETAFVTIRIFDLRGRLIRLLADGEPVSHDGQFIWDGKDHQGRMARIGAYVCLFQALNPEKRVHRELKDTIILVKQ